MESNGKCLWEMLWDYDPNGLVVVGTDYNVRVVNPAFCRMFDLCAEDVLGKPVASVLGDDAEFRRVRDEGAPVLIEGKAYPDRDFYARQVIFPVKEADIIACILVDLTHEWQQKTEMETLRRETIQKVHEVVDKQMKVAQEIAGLLGETTAETKTSLFKLIQVVGQEIV